MKREKIESSWKGLHWIELDEFYLRISSRVFGRSSRPIHLRKNVRKSDWLLDLWISEGGQHRIELETSPLDRAPWVLSSFCENREANRASFDEKRLVEGEYFGGRNKWRVDSTLRAVASLRLACIRYRLWFDSLRFAFIFFYSYSVRFDSIRLNSISL